MIALAVIFVIVAIAVLAIVCCLWLLDRARHLRDRIAELEYREAAVSRHCLVILEQRNQARNALLHASEELNRERLLRACSGRGFFRVDTGDA